MGRWEPVPEELEGSRQTGALAAPFSAGSTRSGQQEAWELCLLRLGRDPCSPQYQPAGLHAQCCWVN